MCRLCDGSTTYVHSAYVMDKYEAHYEVCQSCKYLQISNPHWLDEAYEESMNLSDTGQIQRNLLFSKYVLITLYLIGGKRLLKNGSFLDYGAGYGFFVRLMRDIGLNIYWSDPYTKNLLAKGFEGDLDRYDALVAFEVLEHLESPKQFFEGVFQKSDFFIGSTQLYGEKPPKAKSWWYYALSHGQHIGFYHRDTMKFISTKFNLNQITIDSEFHIFTKHKIPDQFNIYFKILLLMKFDKLVSRNLKSKTFEDHLKMIEVEKELKKLSKVNG